MPTFIMRNNNSRRPLSSWISAVWEAAQKLEARTLVLTNRSLKKELICCIYYISFEFVSF